MATYRNLANAKPHVKLEAFFGVDLELQRRIGTLIVLFSMIEATAELLVWTLAGERLSDGVPTTDRLQFSELIVRLRSLADRTDNQRLTSLLLTTIDAAEQLIAVRHTIAHGRPTVSDGTASLARNTNWFGEARRRPSTILTLTIDNLDAAAEVADAVHICLGRIGAVSGGQLPTSAALELGPLTQQQAQRITRIHEALRASANT